MLKLFIAAFVTLVIAQGASAQQFYLASDGTIDFVSPAFIDSSDPANWDMMTSTVAITRDSGGGGIYNTLVETNYSGSAGSPVGTLWIFGNSVQDVIDGTVDISDFSTWEDAHGSFPPGTVGVDAVVYLSDDDAYVDIRFTNWGIGPGGGGAFAYTRAIIPAPGALAVLIPASIFATRRRR